MRTAKQILWTLEQHFRRLGKQSMRKSFREYKRTENHGVSNSKLSDEDLNSIWVLAGKGDAFIEVANRIMLARLGNRMRRKKRAVS